jgi:hypothetical protein
MKRFTVLIVLVIMGLSQLPAQSAGGIMYVALKSAALKSSTGFFASTIADLQQGDAVTVLGVQDKWVEIRGVADPSLTGWMALASLTSKRIGASGRSVSTGELALAGKGFSADVEMEYRQGEHLDYTAINALEAVVIPDAELLRFVTDGHLTRGE